MITKDYICNVTISKIKEIFYGINDKDVTLESDLVKDLDGDSVDIVELILTLEDEFDLVIQEEEARKFNKVFDIVEYISNNIKE